MSTDRSRPLLALVPGDAAGIGPELTAKILAGGLVTEDADLLLVADERVLLRGAAFAGVSPRYQKIDGPNSPMGSGVMLWDLEQLDPAQVPPGKVSGLAGRVMLDALALAIRLAQSRIVAGVVYGPLNKEALAAGGSRHRDELQYFAELTRPTGYHIELNVLDRLWTSRVTSHVPLREVASLISRESILDSVRLLDRSMKMAGIAAPRIGVAGLNPHCGDGGLFGDEESTTIGPAVASAAREGILASGPYSADTIFLRAAAGELDGVVSMYHDQGQIATKMQGFHRGVTVAGGLPVILTTPAHGTAFDIAGTGKCDTGAMVAAIRLAASMARAR